MYLTHRSGALSGMGIMGASTGVTMISSDQRIAFLMLIASGTPIVRDHESWRVGGGFVTDGPLIHVLDWLLDADQVALSPEGRRARLTPSGHDELDHWLISL